MACVQRIFSDHLIIIIIRIGIYVAENIFCIKIYVIQNEIAIGLSARKVKEMYYTFMFNSLFNSLSKFVFLVISEMIYDV